MIGMKHERRTIAFDLTPEDWKRFTAVARKSGNTLPGLTKDVVFKLCKMDHSRRPNRKGRASLEQRARRVVAFRATLNEWEVISQIAAARGLSVPALAKQELSKALKMSAR
jgi:hypothetical protein